MRRLLSSNCSECKTSLKFYGCWDTSGVLTPSAGPLFRVLAAWCQCSSFVSLMSSPSHCTVNSEKGTSLIYLQPRHWCVQRTARWRALGWALGVCWLPATGTSSDRWPEGRLLLLRAAPQSSGQQLGQCHSSDPGCAVAKRHKSGWLQGDQSSN